MTGLEAIGGWIGTNAVEAALPEAKLPPRKRALFVRLAKPTAKWAGTAAAGAIGSKIVSNVLFQPAETIPQTITQTVTNATSNLATGAANTASSITDATSSFFAPVSDAFSSLFSRLDAAKTFAGESFSNTTSSLLSPITTPFSDALDSLSTTATAIKTAAMIIGAVSVAGLGYTMYNHMRYGSGGGATVHHTSNFTLNMHTNDPTCKPKVTRKGNDVDVDIVCENPRSTHTSTKKEKIQLAWKKMHACGMAPRIHAELEHVMQAHSALIKKPTMQKAKRILKQFEEMELRQYRSPAVLDLVNTTKKTLEKIDTQVSVMDKVVAALQS
jgi:hypothetical protein